jgi:DNA-binding XRE family transcriptional regulator
MTILEEVLHQKAQTQLPDPTVRRHLRQRAGLSQETMARLLEVTRPSFSRYENGRRRPKDDVARRYARLLDELAEAIKVSP